MSIIMGVLLSLASFIIIAILKAAKLFRLTIPLLYIAIILIFFKDWYAANTLLAHIVLGVLTGAIIISWIATICRKISERNVKRRQDELDLIINSKRLHYVKIERTEQ